jgi:DNA topoisomerase-3
LLEEEIQIIFLLMFEQAEKIDQALGHYLQETAQELPPIQTEEQTVNQTVLKCPSCGMDMVLRNRREGTGKFITCMGYPDCRNAVWFLGIVEDVELSGESCSEVCES